MRYEHGFRLPKVERHLPADVAFKKYVDAGIDNALLIIHANLETSQKDKPEQAFFYHTIPHTIGMINRATRLARAVQQVYPDSPVLSEREVELIRLKAAYHDTVQIADIQEQNGALKQVRPRKYENEEKSAQFGKQREELHQKYPDWRERWNYTYIPGAETNAEVQRRFRGALVELAKKHAGQKVAVFAHGQAICLSLCNGVTPTDDLYLKHCGIVQITIDPELGEESLTCVSMP